MIDMNVLVLIAWDNRPISPFSHFAAKFVDFELCRNKDYAYRKSISIAISISSIASERLNRVVNASLIFHC